MIKKLLITLSAVSCLATAQAQTGTPCGTDQVYRQRLAENPNIAVKEAELRRHIAEELSKMDMSKYAKTTADGDVEYHIPIVFHVVHDYGSELNDATDAAIVQCVARINQMFNKRNADTSDVIAPYKGDIPNSKTRYIGNARITWHLATKDPFGKPTTGITHVRSYMTTNASDMTKLDLWPPASYMNVWFVRKFRPSTDGTNPAAYAYQPATADDIPYWDGVISLAGYINTENTISHELGHELNLDHTFGKTNGDGSIPPFPWFVKDCGDDEVDDTPPTKGHKTTGCIPASLYDTECSFTAAKEMMKLRLDSVSIKSDTSTQKGIVFQSRTTTTLDTVSFYPSAPVGSSYTIGLSQDGVLINSKTVVSTVVNKAQRVQLGFKINGAPATVNYKLFFTENAGALRDSVTPPLSTYPKGIGGSIIATNNNSDSMYNFFYNWRFTYGYFVFYPGDSLVDYPDTVNSQNVMDYTYCSRMFSHGQTLRMRAALTSSVAKRDSLWSESNLARTGAMAATPAMAPKADFTVDKAFSPTGLFTGSEPAYFLCADQPGYHFQFRNFSWRAPATSISWALSPGATTPSSSSTTTVTSTFNEGWATIIMTAINGAGTDTFMLDPGVYAADPNAINPVGYYQEFNPGTDLEKWPVFNYYKNRYKWDMVTDAGYFDKTSIRYRTFDDRSFPENVTGDPNGDYDDFFTRGFDLSGMSDNSYLNFMYAGAYNTSDSRQMNDSLEIFYSTNCGGSWARLSSIKGPKLQTAGTITPGEEFKPRSGDDWRAMSIPLKNGTAAIKNSRVYFRFRYRPYGRVYPGFVVATGNNFYIDRINIANWTVGINEMILGDRVAAVAPNPTNGTSYVLFSKTNANVNIQVTDVTGKLVYSINTRVDEQNAKIEIPASAIAVKGMYLVRITGDDNLAQTEKLVVY